MSKKEYQADPIDEQDFGHQHEFLDEEYDEYPTHSKGALDKGFPGDICPRCGIALERKETVVAFDGESGLLMEVASDDVTKPVYHPDCWTGRKEEERGKRNDSLEDYE